MELGAHAALQLVKNGTFKDDCPLDTTLEFAKLCVAVRRGDLKSCQECITAGVALNARDEFDYTPLILASLCGHYEVARLLLESGALCERDTFQGERCLYNALNSRMRNLFLQYDYSKNSDPLQPLSAHVTSLLSRTYPQTSDITLIAFGETFYLHKFVLAARSPYFQKKLAAAPETSSWKPEIVIPSEVLHVVLRYLYLGELPGDLGLGPKGQVLEDVVNGINLISKQFEIESLWRGILGRSDRKIARQWYQCEIVLGRDQLEAWFRDNVLRQKIEVETSRAGDVKWTRDNATFADVLLRADEEVEENEDEDAILQIRNVIDTLQLHSIPVVGGESPPISEPSKPRKSFIYPVHRAMIIRAGYFLTMFSSPFREAQATTHLHTVVVDISPEVLEVVLTFLYTETAEFPLEMAVDVLYAADMLFIEKLKTKAVTIISTLGDPRGSTLVDRTHPLGGEDEAEIEVIDVYEVIRAAWITRVPRLEEFAARYLAGRLEDYIDEPAFGELIRESASRISRREETDTIELLDDIRYYLSERFRLRFQDVGLEVMTEDVNERAEEDTPTGQITTIDGEIAGDEFASDAINYEVLLGKIDALLEHLKLDA